MPSLEHQCEWRDYAQQLQKQLELATQRINELERQVFGPKSERIVPVDWELKSTEPKDSKRSEEERKANRQQNAELKTKIKTETVFHPVLPEKLKCPHCGGVAAPFGQGDATTEFDWVPGYFIRRLHVQQTVACKCGGYIVKADAPQRVFEGGRYGAGLITHVIVSKCLDSLPIYRLEQQFNRLRIPMARSTLNDLVHRAAETLHPLYEALLRIIANHPYVQADETSFKLQHREGRGFVWTFLSGKLIAYVFSGDRSGQTPARILGGTKGALTVDGYTGYNKVTEVDGRERGGCLSHARRKLFEALPTAPEAREALDIILELFRVERDVKERALTGTPEHFEIRQRRSKPIVEHLKLWLEERQPNYAPQGPMAIAVNYCLNQWEPLTLFLKNVNVAIHNNASEAALRIIALGRHNFLFFGNEQAAMNFSVLYSLASTCKANDVNPLDYFADVLLRVQSHPAKEVEALLPHRWSKLTDTS